MTRLILFLPFIVAAPFLKSALIRRGVAAPIAYAGGFALLALGILVVRFTGQTQ
ncbi:MAG: hypothetical protein ABIQ55_04880 [Gemmatimonadaceae bacterium]